ncbi:ribosomal protein S6 kinase beta-1 [Trichonephila clavipes]|nr:ribosomal protein S6 kinase beta-1 [Trichonephila clavipes]
MSLFELSKEFLLRVFYVGEIILAVQHLHVNGIVHRDLKLNNVLLDSEGHVKLCDFGLSKENMFDGCTTYSFCGTLDYMAPEIIKMTGHGKAVDWWSLGVLMYTVIIGYPPFQSENRSKTIQKILNKKLSFPSHVSRNAMDIMAKAVKALNLLEQGWAIYFGS